MIRDFFRWDPPGPWLHVLALVDHAPAVAGLGQRHQETLAAVTALRPVPMAWLHVTVAKLRPALEVDQARRAELVTALQARCATVPPIHAIIGPGQVGRSHVRLAVHPEPEFRALMTAVADTAAAVLGHAIPAPPGLPHLTVAYGVRDDPTADPHIVNDVPGRAECLFREVVLVDQIQDHTAGRCHWTTQPKQLHSARRCCRGR